VRDVEKLQAIALMLPIVVALFGAGVSLYNSYSEPDFANGKYYEAAWLNYQIEHNDLYVTYTPDTTGERVILASIEAVSRVAQKAKINPKIDSKPLILHTLVSANNNIYETLQATIRGKWLLIADNQGLLNAEQRDQVTREFIASIAFSPPPVVDYTVIDDSGEVMTINTSKYTKTMMNKDRVFALYSSDSFQDKIEHMRE
jgi:hypothetical protein